MKLPFDLLSQNYKKPRVFLCETNKDRICELDTIDMSASLKFNTYSELTFTVGRTYTNTTTGVTDINPFYDKIQALRLIFLEGLGYFEIQDPEIVSDGIREVKNITAYSLEYTLSQKYLEKFKINTGEVDSVEVIYSENNKTTLVPVSLYDSNAKLSLLDLVMEKIYGWKIGHVDYSLHTMTRTFDIARTSVYDFIVQDICEKFNCFAVFDTINNTINLYAESLITKHIGDGKTTTFKVFPAYSKIDTVSVDGYKTTKYTYFVDPDKDTGYLTLSEPPENGAKIEITDGDHTDWTTDVYVTFQNLAQEVNVNYSADDIKTVLTVKGAEDLDIREVNMGLPYIVDISYYYNVDWMGQELFDAYTTYMLNNSSYQDTYTNNAKNILELQNDISFAENRTSLGYGVDSSVSSTTVGTYYVISGGSYPNYTYREVSLPDDYNANTTYYKINGVNITESKVLDLYTAVRKYFFDMYQEKDPELENNEDEDEEDTWEKLLEELSEQFEFIPNEFETLKSALTEKTSASDAKKAFRTFLDIIWNEMGRTPLKTLFLESYQDIEGANKEAGYDDKNSDHYWFYYPVTIMLASLNAVIEKRTQEIDTLTKEKDAKSAENAKIAENMLMNNNFTPSQLARLSSFLREDEYIDDSFVETSIDTIDTLMKTKQELLECGRIELSKLCEPKLTFSMDMANIYALPEFEPIVHQFQLGKLINVAIRDDYVKRARLLAVNINFDDFSDFTCEFGELTSLKTQSSIHADLLASAIIAGQTVANNLSYWNKGADIATSTDLKIQEGLLYGTKGLISSDQGVIIDNNGIKLTKIIDQNTGEVSPYQAWIKNNTILFSSDGFKTARTGLGEFTIGGQTFYGPLAEAMFAGYIEGSRIVGGTINIGNGTFTVDSKGNVKMNAASISGYVTDSELDSVENDLSSRISVTESGIETKVSKDSIISTINQSAEKVTINANKISLAGKKINLTSDSITIASTNFSVTKDGKITAKSGTIGSWNIGDMENYTASIYTTYCAASTPSASNPEYAIFLRGKGDEKTLAMGVKTRKSSSTSWNDADTPFYVRKDGYVKMANANVTGTIYADDGEIAGWTIYDNLLRKEVTVSGVDYQMYMQAADGGDNGTNAFAVRKKSSSATDWDVQFAVNYAGKMTAKNANITGTITATDGSIAGYNIGSGGSYENAIYKRVDGGSTDYEVGLKATDGDTDLAFYVKKSTDNWDSSENTFYIRNNGKLYAQDADITGKITASSGKIGGCTISDGVLNISAANITSGTIASARIPNLNADKITAGTLDVGRIPNISASKITSGTISTDRLDASVITTGNFSSKTLSTGNLTVASGCRLGVASEYNALIRTVGDYTYIRGYGPDVNYETSFYNLVKYVVQNSSNREIKTDIHDFDDRYDSFFDQLNPQLFKYNFEPNMGYTMGYIWQEAEQARIDAGLDRNDIGAITETDSVVGGLALSKQDFIALNTWQIQKLKARIVELENKLDAIERNDTK